MAQQSFDRRDFHKLTTAALGGLAAGAVLGCSKKDEKIKGGDGITQVATNDVHLCRGLNECKGQGKDGKNSCRGQGSCATAKEHSCASQNDCKGLGGCGGKEGANECRQKGGCSVPLMEGAWESLRKKKEAEWGEKKLEIGPAPPKAA